MLSVIMLSVIMLTFQTLNQSGSTKGQFYTYYKTMRTVMEFRKKSWVLNSDIYYNSTTIVNDISWIELHILNTNARQQS